MDDISHAHIVSLIYILISSGRGSDDLLSMSLDRDRGRRRQELPNIEDIKGKDHVRIMLKGNYDSAEQQEKDTFGLGYKLALTRININAILNKAEAIADSGIKIDIIHWHLPHYTHSIPQQVILSKQVISKTPTQLRYIKHPFLEKVKTENL